ncbi:hypothetical protein [Aureimonas sp. AU4]|uniref:hypothetical protein n=1 Tax=Aureimonas sp. AU4 TaxID=1638163 RepID=UPI000781E841|nr:hypothetical protein [Aureimonas sp. AU4]
MDITAAEFLLRVALPSLLLAPTDYISAIEEILIADGVTTAVARRDTPFLVDWLIAVSQFQGISDRNAAAFTAKHGLVGWGDIADSLRPNPSCPRLRSFWSFNECGYRKASYACAEPGHLTNCPLPHHPTRKGSLIQAAYALFFFVRDLCDGDLIGWIDQRLADADPGLDAPDRAVRMGAALLSRLRGIYGIGDKVWSMALADLLLASDPNRERWITTGAGMVVVDSLLHNHLHRTGVLRRFDADHAYGPRCYAPGGCSDLIRGLAKRVDARQFNADFPACFPRFVQFAMYRLCSTQEINLCNGVRIDDRDRCRNVACPVFTDCDRVALHG